MLLPQRALHRELNPVAVADPAVSTPFHLGPPAPPITIKTPVIGPKIHQHVSKNSRSATGTAPPSANCHDFALSTARPTGPTRRFFEISRVESSRVGTCSTPYGSGRVGSGRVGSGRVGSGRVGSGRVGSGRVGSGHDMTRATVEVELYAKTFFE